MPGLDGSATLAELQPEWPLRKQHRTSGLKRDATPLELLVQGAVGFLEKPFKIKHLIGVVHKSARTELNAVSANA
jgi:hypothetical protein